MITHTSLTFRLAKCDLEEYEYMAILYALQIAKDAIKSGSFDTKRYGLNARDHIDAVQL